MKLLLVPWKIMVSVFYAVVMLTGLLLVFLTMLIVFRIAGFFLPFVMTISILWSFFTNFKT